VPQDKILHLLHLPEKPKVAGGNIYHVHPDLFQFHHYIVFPVIEIHAEKLKAIAMQCRGLGKQLLRPSPAQGFD
jgi:hypothetical protein